MTLDNEVSVAGGTWDRQKEAGSSDVASLVRSFSLAERRWSYCDRCVCGGRDSNGAHVTSAQGEGLQELSWAEAGMRLAEDPITLAVSAVTNLQMPLESQDEAQECHF